MENTQSDSPSDQEKWEAEKAFRHREITIKEQEQINRQTELKLKVDEQKSSTWRNPVFVALIGAVAAAAGNALISLNNGIAQRNLEKEKSEQTRILEMIKTGDPDKAAENLGFLVNAGLISDSILKRKIIVFLAERQTGTGPALASESKILESPVINNARIYLLSGNANKSRGFDSLRNELIVAGFSVVGARSIIDEGRPDQPEVRYFSESDQSQAEKIAKFMQSKLSIKSLNARFYKDLKVKPGYMEIWLGR